MLDQQNILTLFFVFILLFFLLSETLLFEHVFLLVYKHPAQKVLYLLLRERNRIEDASMTLNVKFWNFHITQLHFFSVHQSVGNRCNDLNY